MAPLAKGLGFAVVSVGLFLAFYYNVVVSWSIWYLLASLNPSLEWSRQVIRNSELLLSTTTSTHPFLLKYAAKRNLVNVVIIVILYYICCGAGVVISTTLTSAGVSVTRRCVRPRVRSSITTSVSSWSRSVVSGVWKVISKHFPSFSKNFFSSGSEERTV